jgi:rSAM/selenodomain-associated transferase 2
MSMPFISIIIPALNESGTINATLHHLSFLTVADGLEVVVVDGSSAGTTLNALNDQFDKRFKLKTTLAPKGRGAQMNRGAALTEGEILMFLHADTMISQEAIDRLQREMKDREATVGGAFDLGILSSKKVYRFIETMANLRSRITRLPYGDQALFFRKEYFLKIDGFSEIPLMEDVDIMQRVKKRKGKIRILPVKVQTSPRRWEREGIVYCTLRNWLLISLYTLGVPPKRLSKYYQF